MKLSVNMITKESVDIPRVLNDFSNIQEFLSRNKEKKESRCLMGIRGRDKTENEFRQEVACDLYIEAINN